MRTRYLTIVLVFSGLFVAANKSYACPPPAPIADLSAEPENTVVGQSITFDGSGSWGSGGISKYEWDFNGDGIYDYYETSGYCPDGAFDGITTHIYNTAGTYIPVLRVTEGYYLHRTDTDSCTVTVGEIIEINSDITTNQLWTANNIYYVTDWVNIQALLVIEPNTMVIFGYGCGLCVNNGGTLISKGTPDKPIIYTCDFMYFYYPEYIGYYWQYLYYYGEPYYSCPIYIEKTASPATSVAYNFIEGAVVGILTENITLDHPIENNYLFGNLYGIGELGTKHTDIKNNLCFFNDYSGIDVHLADVNDTGDANSHILIQNNTCDSWQYYGITVHGVEDEDNAGSVMLVNNIVTGSYLYGLNLVDGYMMFDVRNTGYGGNGENKNGEFEETNPVEATQNPYRYIEGGDYFDIRYLDPNCVFINAGLGYIDETPLIGMTTDINGTPDSNFVDLGFHHPNWNYSNEPNIIPTISGDPNNLTGTISIGVDGYGVTTERIFVLIDGEYKDELEYFDSNMPILLESDNYRNGGHSIKLVAIDINGLVTVSDALETDFNNTFFNIIALDYFHPTADYKILGFHNGAGSFEAKVTNMAGQVIWSNTYNGLHVNIVIPGSTFGNEQFCELSITGSGATKLDITKEFRPEDCPAGVKMVIVLPNEDIFKARKDAVFACATACNQRNVSWVSICCHDVTEENLTFLYNKSSVKYIYWCGHANDNVKGVYRTHTECWRKGAWYDIFSKWHKIKVFSYTRKTIPDAEPLPDNWDDRGFDLWSLGMHNSWNKKIVFVDGCLSAICQDMAYAYGMFSLQGYGSLDQIYIGWMMVVQEKEILDIFAGDTTKGVKLFWERMGRNDENSVRQALQYTCDHPISGPMLITMWGLNLETNLGDVNGDDGIFVWGLGFVNLNHIKLEP
jgi:hypothetical protein